MNLIELTRYTADKEKTEKYLRGQGILRVPFSKFLIVIKLFEIDTCKRSCKTIGKRFRGAAGNVTVFGILERGGKVKVKSSMMFRVETLIELAIKKVKRGSLILHRINSGVAIDLSHVDSNTTVSSMGKDSQMERSTSMELKDSGLLQSND